MEIQSIDHIVLTSSNIPQVVEFYTSVLGMEREVFGDDRIALKFGNQKINLHESGKEISPHAAAPSPGSLDVCLITDSKIRDVVSDLAEHGVAIELGPVARTGANGPIDSVYVRDPDNNLVEISSYNRTATRPQQ